MNARIQPWHLKALGSHLNVNLPFEVQFRKLQFNFLFINKFSISITFSSFLIIFSSNPMAILHFKHNQIMSILIKLTQKSWNGHACLSYTFNPNIKLINEVMFLLSKHRTIKPTIVGCDVWQVRVVTRHPKQIMYGYQVKCKLLFLKYSKNIY